MFTMKNLLEKFQTLIKNDRALTKVIIGSVIYTVIFSAISFLRYEAFSYSDYDSAVFIHEAWKIMHGRSDITLLDGASIWGNAVDVVTYLIAPYFALFAFNPKSLFALQALSLGFGAVPLFLIARRKIPQSLALALAISYLFY